MKRELVDILACPVCRSGLELTVTQEAAGEIITGSLRCPGCKTDYPIEGSIPNLIPPPKG